MLWETEEESKKVFWDAFFAKDGCNGGVRRGAAY